MQAPKFPKNTFEAFILKLLRDESRMHNAELLHHLKELSMGKIRLPENALLPTLHKMEAEGLLHCEQLMENGQLRKYYKLTARGKVVSRFKMTEFDEFIDTVFKTLDLNSKSA